MTSCMLFYGEASGVDCHFSIHELSLEKGSLRAAPALTASQFRHQFLAALTSISDIRTLSF